MLKLARRWGGLRFAPWPRNSLLLASCGSVVVCYIGLSLSPDNCKAIVSGLVAGIVLSYLRLSGNRFETLCTVDRQRFLLLGALGAAAGWLVGLVFGPTG